MSQPDLIIITPPSPDPSSAIQPSTNPKINTTPPPGEDSPKIQEQWVCTKRNDQDECIQGHLVEARECAVKTCSLHGSSEFRHCSSEISRSPTSAELEPKWESGNETMSAHLLQNPKSMCDPASPCVDDIVKKRSEKCKNKSEEEQKISNLGVESKSVESMDKAMEKKQNEGKDENNKEEEGEKEKKETVANGFVKSSELMDGALQRGDDAVNVLTVEALVNAEKVAKTPKEATKVEINNAKVKSNQMVNEGEKTVNGLKQRGEELVNGLEKKGAGAVESVRNNVQRSSLMQSPMYWTAPMFVLLLAVMFWTYTSM